MPAFRLLAVALFAAAIAAPAAAQEFSSLEERMSAAEFKAAGLDKLSPEELEALNRWLRGQRTLQPAAATPGAAASGDRRGLSPDADASGPIESRIVGEFSGWSGAGVQFTLENGMVWESTDTTSRLVAKLSNPKVRITPGFMKAWFLQVEGYNAQVRVKRIK